MATKELVNKEIRLLKRLDHPNVVKYVDSEVRHHGSAKKLEALVLMEYCPGKKEEKDKAEEEEEWSSRGDSPEQSLVMRREVL